MIYSQATETRRALLRQGALSDADFDRLERAEAYLLKHMPTSIFEADELLEIIRDNVETGQRVDGLDIRALDNLRTWLRKNAPGWTDNAAKTAAA